MQAIFMLGEQRSGSNLLRRLLQGTPRLAAPHPAHLLERLAPLLERYQPLTDDHAFGRLVDDACRLVELNPVPWRGIRLDRREIVNRCRERRLEAVLGALMDVYAEARTARAWLCADLENIRFFGRLERAFPGARYVYLHRDARDVVRTFLNAPVGHKHPYFIARQWALVQRACLQARERVGPRRFFSLRYEDLLDRPRVSLVQLCEFLGVRFHEGMLSLAHPAAEVRGGPPRPEIDGAAPGAPGRWSGLTPEALRITESIAGDLLDALGYERCAIEPGCEIRYSPAQVELFRVENERLKRRATGRDATDRSRPQRMFLERIRARSEPLAAVAS